MVRQQRLLGGPATRAHGGRARQVIRDADMLARERWMLAAGFGGGVVCVALQLVNCVWLGVAWPHLATITWHLAMSFIVFVRLVQPEARP